MVSSKALLLVAASNVGPSCLIAGCGHCRESFYPTLADTNKDEAIAQGWVPDDLLRGSSRAIREVHDILPSMEWCAFEFLRNDSEHFRKNLKSVVTAKSLLH
jgi:hypothetical protein